MATEYENGWQPREDRVCEPEGPEYEAKQPKCKIAMPEEVFFLCGLSDTERRLLHLLEALCVNGRPRCYPRNSWICFRLDICESTLDRALGDLRVKGYVETERLEDPFASRGITRYIRVTGKHRADYRIQMETRPAWQNGPDDDPFCF